MHPTALGHRVMADGVDAALGERGWFRGERLERDPGGGAIPRYDDPWVRPPGSAPPTGAGLSPSREVLLEGVVRCSTFRSGTLQVDVVDATVPRVLGSARLAGPGPFQVRVPSPDGPIRFVAYLDVDADGPGPGDLRVDAAGGPLTLPAHGMVRDLVVDLDGGHAVETFAGKAVTP